MKALLGGTRGKRLIFILSAVICAFVLMPLHGQNPPPAAKEARLTAAQRKIDASVRKTMAQLVAAGIDRSRAASRGAAQGFSGPLVKVDSQARIHVYVEYTELDATRLAALGPSSEIDIDLTNEKLKMVQAWIPYDRLDAIASLNFVTRIRPPAYARKRTGSATSQGDLILKANAVRNTLGFTGSGVKVGVISDGANHLASAQASGDLPASITVFGACAPTLPGDCDEGTAMLEIVHDLAPGATLGMGDVSTSLEFIQRVADLTNWGAKVIVDDLIFFAEPYFEDGTVAQAYANAVAHGIVVVSAAGNG